MEMPQTNVHICLDVRFGCLVISETGMYKCYTSDTDILAPKMTKKDEIILVFMDPSNQSTAFLSCVNVDVCNS